MSTSKCGRKKLCYHQPAARSPQPAARSPYYVMVLLAGVLTLHLSNAAQAVVLTATEVDLALSGKQNNNFNFAGLGFAQPGETDVASQRSDNLNVDPVNHRASRTFVEFTLTAGFIAEAQAALGTGKRVELSFDLKTVFNEGYARLEGLDFKYFGVAAGDRTASTLWNAAALESAHNVIYATTAAGTHTGSFSHSQVLTDIAAATPGQVIAFGLVTDRGVDNLLPIIVNPGRQSYILDSGVSTYTLGLSQDLQLVTPTGITQTQGTSWPQFNYVPQNLINNSGFATVPTIADFTSVAYSYAAPEPQWATQTGTFPSNYFATGQIAPQFTLDLGGSFDLTDLVVWGHGNANEASDFLVEFSTDGGATYYASRLVQTSSFLNTSSAVLTFGGVFEADFIRLTMLNNIGGRGLGLPGEPGDRVALGEIKFLALAPSSAIPEPATLSLLGLAGLAMLRRRRMA